MRSFHLEDRHLIAMAQLLPLSQLEVLHLSFNNIQAPGILELARQLGKIRSLKKICLERNPWIQTREARDKCYAALLQGMMNNYSIEYLHPIQRSPQAILLQHYMDLNRAGRRILTSSDPVPLGLWPWVLERAGKMNWSSKVYDEITDAQARVRCANVVFFFLRYNHDVILPLWRNDQNTPSTEASFCFSQPLDFANHMAAIPGIQDS
jgi:hypothetical protein